MPYIGQQVPGSYQATKAVQRFDGDNSTTTFTLTTTVSSVQDVLVSVDGVVQDTAAYTIPDGVTLTFSAAPSSGLVISSLITLHLKLVPLLLPLRTRATSRAVACFAPTHNHLHLTSLY